MARTLVGPSVSVTAWRSSRDRQLSGLRARHRGTGKLADMTVLTGLIILGYDEDRILSIYRHL